ncbi:MAG: rRNA maturation RNase YbeY [Eubacteriales bacterium]|nr:rRNA maturation RNase YbeY [Eubacteriales bacterium]MDD3073121.1 rRNA maturation RNase YbeY [Eubacteriales bacterium]MDD4078273.1 rRNA maturation RNase YbeY [Eubacteriales bacterium]MDD4768236.1 rRNA maturation RNase YbeY [Eubacteriales bacterium]
MQLQLFYEQEFEGAGDLAFLVNQTAQAVEEAFSTSFPQECYNVIVASEGLVRQLNRDFRHNDSVTDVLSFPLGAGDEITGEIYICWRRVESQAQEYGHSRQREFCFLLVHGILHLLGYDHCEEPNPEMRAMEEEILARLNLGRV